MWATLNRVACRIALSLPLVSLAAAGAHGHPGGHTGDLYRIDQRFGSIGFSVDHLGLFQSHGHFARFDGTLFVDPLHPERSRITVTIAANSVAMEWQDGTEIVSSSAYFDVRHHPSIRFRSVAVTAEGVDHYSVQGELEMRGVTRALTLDARLVKRHFDKQLGAEVADIVLRGTILRSMFGMLADRALVSDGIGIRVDVRLQVAEVPPEYSPQPVVPR